VPAPHQASGLHPVTRDGPHGIRLVETGGGGEDLSPVSSRAPAESFLPTDGQRRSADPAMSIETQTINRDGGGRGMDIPRRRSALRRFWPLIAAAAAAILLGCIVVLSGGLTPQRTIRVPASSVTTGLVSKGLFRDATVLNGKVEARDTLFLDALEGGQIQRLLVHAGDHVQAGQPLLELRNSQLQLDVLNQEGRLIESITQLEAYERQLEQQRADNTKTLDTIDYDITRLTRSNERRSKLLDRGFAPREQLDQIQDELAHAQRQHTTQAESNRRLEALRLQQTPAIAAQLASLRRSLAITAHELDDLIVKAPATGRVTSFDLKVGQNRNRGDRLAEITLDSGFKISARVDEFYLGRVSPGQMAQAMINGRDERLVVARVYPQIQNGQFSVDLDFPARQPDGLLPGEAVAGRLYLGADQPALTLPAGAFLERSGGDWVMVVSENGKTAVKRRVRLGRRNSDQVEVLGGLAVGERIITSDYSSFTDVSRVVIK
jgi:HlyD family secretion protein